MKKKSNVIFKVFGIIATILIATTVLGCFSGQREINYNSIEELQSAYPNFYYYNFGVPTEIAGVERIKATFVQSGGGILSSCTSSSEKTVRGYDMGIVCDFGSGDENHKHAIDIKCDSKQSELSLPYPSHYTVLEMIIDTIECVVVYQNISHGTTVFFELEKDYYKFMIGGCYVLQEAEDLLEHYISILTIGITNRHKGS